MIIYHCPVCEEMIRDWGDVAFYVFCQICETHVLHKNYQYESSDRFGISVIIKFLEEKGFVVTTECGENKAFAKPIGHEQLEDHEHFFCIDLQEHSKKILERKNDF